MPALFMTSRIVYYRLLESTKRSPYDISNAAKHASLVYDITNSTTDCWRAQKGHLMTYLMLPNTPALFITTLILMQTAGQ